MVIKPITNPDLFQAVLKAGKADGHELVAPSLVILNGDEGTQIVGAITVLPSMLVWMDRQRTKVRDSLQMVQCLESHSAMSGQRHMCLPCSVHSPYHPLLPKVGFVNLGGYELFVKDVIVK